MQRLILTLLACLSPALWALEIPSHLSQQDRREVVRMLGMNTSAKVLGNPYPLGGYSGFEASVSIELIDITELSNLGCEPGDPGCPNLRRPDESELRYSRITLGKGLYDNVDVFVHFIPPQSGLRISDFAGTARWGFFEAAFAPISLSAQFTISHIDIAGSFSNETIGTEILAGITVDNFCLYFGGGLLRSKGRFSGGPGNDSLLDPTDPTIDSSTNTATEVLNGTHSVVGISLKFSSMFAAAEIDRYHDPVFSGKLGVRF